MISTIISICLFVSSLLCGDTSLMIAAGIFNIAGQISIGCDRWIDDKND